MVENSQRKLTVGSLFAGIGGIELGLEWTGGFETKWQVEIDPYAQRVLAKHWPDCGRWDDVRTFPPPPVDDWRVDLICGGFPCQDISHAGKQAGIRGGDRSGLWSEYIRIVRTLRPKIVIVENVTALLDGGLGIVLADLDACGFDAQWSVFQAAAFGLPHFRSRVFIIAYTHGTSLENVEFQKPLLPDSEEPCRRQLARAIDACLPADTYAAMRGTHDGVPEIMDRLRCLGNAVVPQVAQWIGQRILDAERSIKDI